MNSDLHIWNGFAGNIPDSNNLFSIHVESTLSHALWIKAYENFEVCFKFKAMYKASQSEEKNFGLTHPCQKNCLQSLSVSSHKPLPILDQSLNSLVQI